MPPLPTNRKERNAIVLAIQKAIVETFDRSDWKELGYRTGSEEEITGHHRLLRSLDWNDPDYPGNVLWGIETILEVDKEGFDEILRTEKVAEWLRQNEPLIYTTYVPNPKHRAVPAASPRITSATVDRALQDAETLMKTSGAPSAVDRVHTALHGFLLAVCDEAGNHTVRMRPSPSHPKLRATGPRSQEVTQIIKAFAVVIDALNPLRVWELGVRSAACDNVNRAMAGNTGCVGS